MALTNAELDQAILHYLYGRTRDGASTRTIAQDVLGNGRYHDPSVRRVAARLRLLHHKQQICREFGINRAPWIPRVQWWSIVRRTR